MEFEVSVSLPKLGKLVVRLACRSGRAVEAGLLRFAEVSNTFLIEHPGTAQFIAIRDRAHGIAWMEQKRFYEKYHADRGIVVKIDSTEA
jgi:hypothetical protein